MDKWLTLLSTVRVSVGGAFFFFFYPQAKGREMCLDVKFEFEFSRRLHFCFLFFQLTRSRDGRVYRRFWQRISPFWRRLTNVTLETFN